MYGKMYRQMYHGTLATTGPWQALVTFQQLIVLADRDGVVDMTPEAISRETTIPLEIILLGVEALEQPDSESRSPDEEGRRIVRLTESRSWGWRIVNYEHYRKLRSEEERREYHRQYWHKRKLKQTQHTQPQTQHAQHNSINSTHADADAEAEAKRTAPTPSGSPVKSVETLHPGGAGKPALAAVPALELHPTLPLEEWQEWLAFRRRRRWPMDGTTLKKQLSFLARYPQDAQRVILDKSMNSAWQGLHPPKPGDLPKPAYKPGPTVAEIETREVRRKTVLGMAPQAIATELEMPLDRVQQIIAATPKQPAAAVPNGA